MRDTNVQLTITGNSRGLTTALNQSERGVRSFAGRAQGAFNGLGRTMRGMGKMMAPLAMIGGAAGMIQLTRQVVDYQDSLSTLGIRARLSGEEMMQLSDRFHSLARETGQSREAVVRAMQTMVDDVDVEFATAALEHVAQASTAVSVDIGEAAQAFTIFRNSMGATTEEAAELFNQMVAMDGSFALDRLQNATTLLGVNKDNFLEYNAVLHSIKRNTGNLEGASRAFESVGQALQNPELVAEFQRRFAEFGHTEVFDAQGNIKSFEAFMTAMQDARIPFRDTAQHFRREFAKGVEGFDKRTFDEFVSSGRNGTFVMDAFARKQGEAKFQLNRLTEAGKELATSALLPVVQRLADSFSRLTSNAGSIDKISGGLQGWVTIIENLGHAVLALGRALGHIARFSEDVGGGISIIRNRLPQMQEQLTEEEFNNLLSLHGLDKSIMRGRGIGDAQTAQRMRNMVEYYNEHMTGANLEDRRRHERQAALRADLLPNDAPVQFGNLGLSEEEKQRIREESQRAREQFQNTINLDIHVDKENNITTRIDGQNVTANVHADRGGLTR